MDPLTNPLRTLPIQTDRKMSIDPNPNWQLRLIDVQDCRSGSCSVPTWTRTQSGGPELWLTPVLRLDSIHLISWRGSMHHDRQLGRRHEVYILLRPRRTSQEWRWWSGMNFMICYIKAMNYRATVHCAIEHRATRHRAANMKVEWRWDVGLWTGRRTCRSGQWNSLIQPTLKYVSYQFSTAKTSRHTRTAAELLVHKRFVTLFTSRLVTQSLPRLISAELSSR
jgi:hypothetical protein